MFQHNLTGKDGSSSGFGSWKTVPAVPVPLSVSGITVPTVLVRGSGSVPEPHRRLGDRPGPEHETPPNLVGVCVCVFFLMSPSFKFAAYGRCRGFAGNCTSLIGFCLSTQICL